MRLAKVISIQEKIRLVLSKVPDSLTEPCRELRDLTRTKISLHKDTRDFYEKPKEMLCAIDINRCEPGGERCRTGHAFVFKVPTRG